MLVVGSSKNAMRMSDKLLEQRQPHRQRRRHLLAARQADERPVVAAFFERDAVIFGPLQRVLGVAGDLAKHQVRLERNVIDVISRDERSRLLQRVADERRQLARPSRAAPSREIALIDFLISAQTPSSAAIPLHGVVPYPVESFSLRPAASAAPSESARADECRSRS